MVKLLKKSSKFLKLSQKKTQLELKERLTAQFEKFLLNSDNEDEVYDPFSICMPVLDSKEVIKASPIFEQILGVKLEPEWIRPGGYESCDEAAQDLIDKAVNDLLQVA